MLNVVVLALFAAVAPARDTVPGVIRGSVQSEASGLPVALAVVQADDGTRVSMAMTDSAGRYLLRVPAGRQRIRVHHLEHAPLELEVLVPPGAHVPLDVSLVHRPIALAPIQVRRPADPRADTLRVPATDLGFVIDHHLLDGGAGLTSQLPAPAPGGEGGSGGDVLYVRGSAANLQLVLLDGAPVYAPFHMGGLVESFEPEVVGAARLYLGGAPARYDGGLSYVMDLSTRSGGERLSAGGSLDMVSGRGRVEGPLPAGARYLVSGRAVHGAALDQMGDEPFPYEFRDGLVRVDVPVGAGGVSATGFANHEGVRVDTVGGDGYARWGNTAGSVRWRGRLEGSDVEVTVAGGRFSAELPLRDASRLFVIRGTSDRVRAGVDFVRSRGPVRLRYGASYDRTWLRNTARQPDAFRNLIVARSAGTATGAYVDAAWQPVPRLLLRGGLRGDAFSVGGAVVVAPRGLATVLLGSQAALTLAAGRYHQYVRVPRPVGGPADLQNWADSARIPTQLSMAGATHFSLGLDQELSPRVRLGLEGFYKRFDGLPGADSSSAHTSGVDVWVRAAAEGISGWLGYSLAWAWTSADGAAAAAEFTGRQTLSVGARGTVARGTRVGVRMAYGAGLPYSAVSMGERVLAPGSLPDLDNGSVDLDSDAPLAGHVPEPFLRLDAEVSRTWTPRVGGRPTAVTPYVRVINALDSRDGLFYRYFSGEAEGDEAGVEAVGTLPLVPVVGVQWSF